MLSSYRIDIQPLPFQNEWHAALDASAAANVFAADIA
jgi:hypothetical protein